MPQIAINFREFGKNRTDITCYFRNFISFLFIDFIGGKDQLLLRNLSFYRILNESIYLFAKLCFLVSETFKTLGITQYDIVSVLR